MTEPPGDGDVEQVDAEPVRTGHVEVDDVLASLDDLDDDAVDAHVAIFERAHEQLRGALDRPRP